MGARRRQSAKQVPKVQEDAKWSRMVLKKPKVANKWPMLWESRKNRIFLLLMSYFECFASIRQICSVVPRYSDALVIHSACSTSRI